MTTKADEDYHIKMSKEELGLFFFFFFHNIAELKFRLQHFWAKAFVQKTLHCRLRPSGSGAFNRWHLLHTETTEPKQCVYLQNCCIFHSFWALFDFIILLSSSYGRLRFPRAGGGSGGDREAARHRAARGNPDQHYHRRSRPDLWPCTKPQTAASRRHIGRGRRDRHRGWYATANWWVSLRFISALLLPKAEHPLTFSLD